MAILLYSEAKHKDHGYVVDRRAAFMPFRMLYSHDVQTRKRSLLCQDSKAASAIATKAIAMMTTETRFRHIRDRFSTFVQQL